jgi:8-oxo-dGTP diphosphatase
VVRYFVMRDQGGSFEPGAEVDELRWLDRAAAHELLSYARDREVLDRW